MEPATDWSLINSRLVPSLTPPNNLLPPHLPLHGNMIPASDFDICNTLTTEGSLITLVPQRFKCGQS
jgi:hypothetical protein